MISNIYQGFCPFRRYHRVVHWAGYLSGLGIWICSYLLAGVIVPSVGLVSVAVTTVVASVSTAIYIGVLYSRAIGSPWGNILFPLGVPLLIPELILTRPFPGTTMPESWFRTHLVLLGGILVGIVITNRTIQIEYAKMDDILEWERAVMPHSVRVVDDEWLAKQPAYDREYKTVRPILDPRITEWYDVRFDLKGGLLGMAVAAPAIAASAYGVATYNDVAFNMAMGLAAFFLIHNSYRIENEELERTSPVQNHQ